MLDAYFLLNAMSGIHDEQVKETGEFLGILCPSRKSRAYSKLWRTLLIAAAIAALFTVTAYAMGWFGLRERTIELPTPTDSTCAAAEAPRRWLSLNGYTDSSEYAANLDWLAFWHEYTASNTVDDDADFTAGMDEATVNTCRFYGVYDEAMLEELKTIAENYGLALHTRQVSPMNLTDFYLAAGTGEFLPGGEAAGYVYEDGSFKLEGSVYPNKGSSGKGSFFTLTKTLSGTIVPLWYPIEEPEEYSQWEYTNIYGDNVLICFDEGRDDLCILFESDGIFIQLGSSSPADPQDCEALADCFVFHELLKTEVDLTVASHGPTVYREHGMAATLTDFLESPEGMAANEYYAYAQGLKQSWGPYSPWTDSLLLEKYSALSEKYSLNPGSGLTMVLSSDQDLSVPEGSMGISPEEFADLGYNERLAESFDLLFIYDNGVIQAQGGLAAWLYIPKGALSFSLSREVAADYSKQWFYLTDCGETVCIAADLPESERSPVILYETEGGWLLGRLNWYHSAYEPEAAADEIDYTLFP